MKWPRVKLDSIKADVRYAFVGGPFGSNLTTRDYREDGVPVIRGNNLPAHTGFHDDEFAFVSGEKAADLKSNIARPGDVIFTQRGTLGQVGVIPKGARFPEYVISQSQMKLTVDPSKADARFIYYFFRSPETVQNVVNRSLTSGVPHINLGILKSFDVPQPPLDVQERVVETLSAYDDLIGNNRRRMQLLEQSARLLYQEWFIRLRFPGHEHVKITDGVPEGWEKLPLASLCNDVRDQIDPSNVAPDTPYIGLEHIPRREITLGEWGQASDVDSSKFQFQAGDFLFGKIRPYFHKVGIALVTGITSSDAVVLRAGKDWLYAYTAFLVSSDQFVALASKTVREGSKMPRADWKFLSAQRFLVPPKALATSFENIVTPVLALLKTLSFQNRQLAQARDLLLPRLMNGEVVV